MIYPVDIDNGGYRGFGYKLGNKFHNGYDFNCPLQTPVKAIMDGIIYYANQNVNGFGGINPTQKGGLVMIKHSYIVDVIALYGHIKINGNIKKNNIIKEGDIIGFVDHYFNLKIDYPHLHFAIYNGNNIMKEKWGYVPNLENWIDPIKYFSM